MRLCLQRPLLNSLLLSWLVIGLLSLSARGASVTATLDTDTILLGDNANLEIFVEGARPDSVPMAPNVPGLAITYTGMGSKFTMINGQTMSGYMLNFSITATKRGDFVIPAMTVMVEGKRLATQALRLKVGGDTDVMSKLATLKITVPRTEVFVGEVFPVDIQLLVQDGREINIPQLQAEGFTVSPMKHLGQTQSQINGVIYHVLTFKTTATAARAGNLTLGPVQCTLQVRVPTSRGRTRDPFGGGVFDSFFGGGAQYRRVTLESEKVVLQVRNVPRESAPADFKGAIGNFTLTVSATPTNIAVGDPITVKMVLAGQGAWDGLAAPVLDGWRDFKVYPPTSRVDTNDVLGFDGVKTFEQVVVPENAEARELPPISFSYFDPARKSFRTLQQPAIPLIVRPVASSPAQPVIATTSPSSSEPPPQQDIVHIKTRAGNLALAQPPLLRQGWFLALQSLPVALWVAAFLWRKRSEHLANNPRLIRRRQVAAVVKQGLTDLQKLAVAGDTAEFHALMFRLLQEQIGERLDLPASAITEAVIDERLRPRGVPEPTLVALHDLFQACNLARYAPQSTSEELSSLTVRTREALQAIQSLP